MSPSPIETFFSHRGPLKEILPGYLPRQGQIQMAQAIADHCQRGENLLVEAGTGVGKSFAYLAPLLLGKTEGPVVISTGTIALQEQLVEKDLPLLARCIDRPIQYALAKGRNHYLCENRYRRHLGKLEAIAEDERDLETLHRLRPLLGRGVITRSQLPGELSAAAWSEIQSETGLCGHTACRERPCSYTMARAELKNADVIVVNHSLLFVHLQLAAFGAALLPEFKTLVVDEAHHVPGVASEQLGISVSNTQLKFFLDQLYLEHRSKGLLCRSKPEPSLLKKKVVELRTHSEAFFQGMKGWAEREGPENGRVVGAGRFEDPLSEPLLELEELLQHWAASASHQEEEREFRYYASRARSMADEIRAFNAQRHRESAYWLESRESRHWGTLVSCRSSPLNVGELLGPLLFEPMKAVVMTSATLSTSGKDPFRYFCDQIGLDAPSSLMVPSPFEYGHQAGLWCTRQLPDPNEPEWGFSLPAKIRELLDWTAGGAFILTTSHALLRHLHEELMEHCVLKGYPLLAQGLSGERSKLLQAFRQDPHSVLIGSSTFWEGIDVPGRQLRHVIIPRLPFEVPSHPLQEARVEKVQREGGNPFVDLALPQAIIRFRQGFGRLIRSTSDLGIVSVLDSRLLKRRYGRDFLRALPDAKRWEDDAPDSNFLVKLQQKS